MERRRPRRIEEETVTVQVVATSTMAPSLSSSHSPLPMMMASAPSSPRANAVGLPDDLNHSDIAGYMPSELGLLADLALLYLNSNRFRASSR
ncbi:hypothetical protein OsI_13599 [Oryza sativa Indica Group]|nr:hypothetical protein OsI_13599 [Oryza sativa Indica Group]